MSIVQVLGVLGTTFGIITAAVAIALFVRGSYAKVRIEALRDDLDDERKSSEALRNRVGDLEKENERHKARMDGLERENETLKNQPILELNKVLLAVNEIRREWTSKLDAFTRAMNARFDKLEGKS